MNNDKLSAYGKDNGCISIGADHVARRTRRRGSRPRRRGDSENGRGDLDHPLLWLYWKGDQEVVHREQKRLED